jgi:hypothetical protein
MLHFLVTVDLDDADLLADLNDEGTINLPMDRLMDLLLLLLALAFPPHSAWSARSS